MEFDILCDEYQFVLAIFVSAFRDKGDDDENSKREGLAMMMETWY